MIISPTSTTVIETVKPTEGTGGTELTTLNSGQRMCYGSNNYKAVCLFWETTGLMQKTVVNSAPFLQRM